MGNRCYFLSKKQTILNMADFYLHLTVKNGMIKLLKYFIMSHAHMRARKIR